jgi:predicted regulator of amino acid metabolism with ACT domain
LSEPTKRTITAIVPMDLLRRVFGVISKARQIASVARRSSVKIIFAVSPRSLSSRWILMYLGECVAAKSYKGEV